MAYNGRPSEEDFARAHASMGECDRGLNDVCSRILARFHQNNLHEAFIFYSPANDLFVAHLFFLREKEREEGGTSGLTSQIQQAVIEELENIGRGDRDTIKVEFNFDSHENVKANFGGDYYSRLR